MIMTSVWDEVKRLAADFQHAQLSSTTQKLSERNCIEIVKKLIELKLIEVIFTNDGKDYLTPARLLKEIKDELYVHEGRINLVDLAQIIGVDYKHIESKASELVQTESDVHLVLGQLITNDYLNRIAEEVNEKLIQTGQITIGELTKEYDLPGDFLEQVVHEHLGTTIQGQPDASDSRRFFTDHFIAQNRAKIRGALLASTRPSSVYQIINRFSIPESLFYNITNDLISQKKIAGIISGVKTEQALFIPDFYTRAQNKWVDSFFKQNGYLEYDGLSRLGIQDPKSYLRKKFLNEPITYLSTCCVGQNIINLVEANIEDTLNNGIWNDIMPLLPSIFTPKDCHEIITCVTKSLSKKGSIIHVYNNTIVVSDECLNKCQASFEILMKSKAEEDVKKNPHLFTSQHSKTIGSKKDDGNKPAKHDKKDEKKKKNLMGKSGGGTQGRETKIKSVKKKYFTNKAEDSASDEEAYSYSKETDTELEFLDINSIERHIMNLDLFRDCPEELISELAEKMQRILNKKYQEVAKQVYELSIISSSATRRQQHFECQEKVTWFLNHIIMYERGIKFFNDEVSSLLTKHLLKTLCTDFVNMIVNYLSQELGISSDTNIEAPLTLEARQKQLNKFPDNMKQALMKLHNSLNSKTLEDFHNAVEIVTGAGFCDMIIRKADKKKERTLLINHKEDLLKKLESAANPALCLHVAVLLIFQSQTHNLLHASGKFVPHIIAFLQKQVPFEVYQLLANYQEKVMKTLTSHENEEIQNINSTLLEEMLKIKELAMTYKKSCLSETEN